VIITPEQLLYQMMLFPSPSSNAHVLLSCSRPRDHSCPGLGQVEQRTLLRTFQTASAKKRSVCVSDVEGIRGKKVKGKEQKQKRKRKHQRGVSVLPGGPSYSRIIKIYPFGSNRVQSYHHLDVDVVHLMHYRHSVQVESNLMRSFAVCIHVCKME
jgi:hypothetical protein